MRGREQFRDCYGGVVYYNPAAAGKARDGRTAPPNPHHTHFLYVDDVERESEEAMAWGSEIQMRGNVQNMLAKVSQSLLTCFADGVTLPFPLHDPAWSPKPLIRSRFGSCSMCP